MDKKLISTRILETRPGNAKSLFVKTESEHQCKNQCRILSAESPEDRETDGCVFPRNQREEQNGWGCFALCCHRPFYVAPPYPHHSLELSPKEAKLGIPCLRSWDGSWGGGYEAKWNLMSGAVGGGHSLWLLSKMAFKSEPMWWHSWEAFQDPCTHRQKEEVMTSRQRFFLRFPADCTARLGWNLALSHCSCRLCLLQFSVLIEGSLIAGRSFQHEWTNPQIATQKNPLGGRLKH